MNKKECVICEFPMAFKKYFCCNDGIISVLCKLVMLRFATTSGVKTGVENDIFWSKIGSGFGESLGTSPPAILRSTHLRFRKVDYSRISGGRKPSG